VNFDKLNLATIAEKLNSPDAARELLESILWPNGAVCAHCASQNVYRMTSLPESKHKVRPGTLKCRDCRKKFTVTVGTIFEDTHVPLHKWLMAIFLLCSAKKAISAHQLHHSLGVTYKTAWFMAHRIRYAMDSGPYLEMMKGEVVEVDETYVGGKEERKDGKTGWGNKTPVVALVERNGNVRSSVMPRVTAQNLREAVHQHVPKGAVVLTDDSPKYTGLQSTHEHYSVNHSQKVYGYMAHDLNVNTNTVESFFSLLKRGVMGAFNHVSAHHLNRYCNEFNFRWNSRKMKDGERMELAVAGFAGKRLKYRDSLN
jgi:transposase-like protein